MGLVKLKAFSNNQLGFCLVLAITILALNLFRLSTPAPYLNLKNPSLASTPMTPRKSFIMGIPIDVNRAEIATLSLVPGISHTLARSIVEFRDTHGVFKTWNDLRKVKGVGPANIKRFKGFLQIGKPQQTLPKITTTTKAGTKLAEQIDTAIMNTER